MEEGREQPDTPGYQRLAAWQRAMDLVEAVYATSRAWPRDEQYGLTGQARRAAISIPSNLAEGHGRSGRKEYAHHVSIAFGSLCELETQLLIAHRLGYVSTQELEPLLDRIAEARRIILGLLRSLKPATDAATP